MKKILSAVFAILFLSSISYCANIDAALLNRISLASSKEEISAIVYMKDKLDKSELPKKLEDKVAVFDKFSETSQNDVKNFIERSKKRHKVKSLKRFWLFNGFAITADKDLILSLSERPDVERIEENSKISLPPEPKGVISPLSIKYFSSTVESNIVQIKADQVWGLTVNGHSVDGNGVKVGIADTGCLSTHPDLTGKILYQASFDSIGNKTADSAPDTDGHGTHVAGIIAGGNASGKSIGVAPSASLVIAKVFNDDGTSYMSQVNGGVEWIIGKGAKIVNLSLGNPGADSTWKLLVDGWDSLNIIVVSAIGNGGPDSNTTTSPANVPSAVGVGAVDSSDTIASFSSRGPVSWSGTDYTKPDVCAPGVAIKSSFNDGGYKEENGTSMATPHVAGALALMMCANPSLESVVAKAVIKSTAYHAAGETTWPNNNYGWGRIDALNAVKATLGTKPSIESVTADGGKFGEDVSILVAADSNITGTRPDVTLFYRNETDIWESVSMSAESGTSRFNVTIPGSYVTTNVHYYIAASNIPGDEVFSPLGAPDASYLLTITPRESVSISNSITCPNPFSPANGPATFSYCLSKPCDVTTRIYSVSGVCVKTFSSSGTLGYNTFTWDGQMEGNEVAANGVYLYQIIARDSSGSSGSAKGKIIVLR